MSDLDVRDLRGRTHRLVWPTIFGVLGSIFLTLLLPTRNHFPGGCLRSHGWLVEGDSIALILAGAVAMGVGFYALLGAAARPRCLAPIVRAAPLPRAIVRVAR